MLRRSHVLPALFSAFALAIAAAPAGAQPRAAGSFNVSISARPLADALQSLAEQADLQIFFKTEAVKNLRAPAVNGTMRPDQALAAMLAGTELKYVRVGAAYVVKAPKDEVPKEMPVTQGWTMVATENLRLAAAPVKQAATNQTAAQEPSQPQEEGTDVKGIPEILVKGSRGASADIRRTNDDVQPYVVFDSEDIELSMAASLDDFLRARLPMNQSRARLDQVNALSADTQLGNQSRIDLRGLGSEEILILVNGRRMPGVASLSTGGVMQADINGIPLSAIERIEVLPSTAGGIYGGGATGGVVNVVLKRDYNSVEVTARYDGTFDGGGAERRLDATAGFTLGRTEVMLMASTRDGSPLNVGDRDFSRRARELQYRKNPNAYLVSDISFLPAPSPVFGYTTNIRSSSPGAGPGGFAPLVLRNGTPVGSTVAHVAPGSAGYAVDGTFAFRPGYNLDLADSVFGNEYSLLTVPTAHSLQVNLRHQFTDRISAFLDASRLENKTIRVGSQSVTASQATFNLPATLPDGTPNPANPFLQDIRIAVPMVGLDTERLLTRSDSITDLIGAGVTVQLPREWMVQAEYNLGFSDFNSGFSGRVLTAAGLTAIQNGTLNPLRDVNRFPFDFSSYYTQGPATLPQNFTFPSEQKNGTLRVAGPLLKMSGGPLRLSALLDRREEYTGERVISFYSGTTPIYYYYAEAGSTSRSAYAELTAPLFSRVNARPGIRTLDLLASYRYDEVSTSSRDFLSGIQPIPSPNGPFPDVPYALRTVTADQYTLGFRYEPVESLALRVSYGKGVLPPSPSQLSPADNFVFGVLPPTSLRDPYRGNEPFDTSIIRSYTNLGRPGLQPEQSESLSVGLIFKPAVLPGLRLSVDYTHIEKTDEIAGIGGQSLLDQEDLFPGTVIREDLRPEDAALGYQRGRILEFHTGPVNIAEMRMEAFDVQATYDWNTRLGSFAANLVGTIQPDLTRRSTPTSPELNPVGYSDGPMRFRLNTGLRWSLGNVDAGWDMQYYDSYRIYTATADPATIATAVLNQGSPAIPAQTYHDVYARYRFGDTPGFVGGLLKNTSLMLSVKNVLNTSPPILATIVSSGVGRTYATEGSPLLRRYSISFTKSFN